MELEKELLSKFGNRRPFKLPDGYFDSLEMRVMSQIASENTKNRLKSNVVIRMELSFTSAYAH